MPDFSSPLRYPGGKAGLTHLLAEVLDLNHLQDAVYAEPFAGGAGAALSLLLSERVSHILINDADSRLCAFWQSILAQTARFLALLDNTPVTIDEWHRQRAIYTRPARHSQLRVGFATFFLNRCNRSGILVNGGPIGGHEQRGKWRLDARFMKDVLRRRIERIAAYRERITVSCNDALVFLKEVVGPTSNSEAVFVYLDPPYYAKGSKLYLNTYEHDDHVQLASFLARPHPYAWVTTYDNVPAVRRIFRGFKRIPFNLAYTAYKRRTGQELLIHNNTLALPKNLSSLVGNGRRSVA